MIETKLFEIRDAGTLLIVMAHRVSFPQDNRERKMLSHGGYGKTIEAQEKFVFMTDNIRGGTGPESTFTYDIFNWPRDGTYFTAHEYIKKNWSELESGALIDVEFIRGVVEHPAITELG